MIDEDEDIDGLDEASERDTDFLDKVAERTEAYRRLLVSISNVSDEGLRAEGKMMLVAVRSSFKKYSQAELTAIEGGKETTS
jgi:hypothetical protein